MNIVRPLSKRLAGGKLAVLHRPFMATYVRRHLHSWFPGHTFIEIRIRDYSAVPFKKSIAYTVKLRDPKNAFVEKEIRANIPSLDTTAEARNADAAMRTIWSQPDHQAHLPISRPLGFDKSLRTLLYESVPGDTLTNILRRQRLRARSYVQEAGRWLARLHAERIPYGRRRSMALEHRETFYFRLNFGRYYPPCLDEASLLLDRFLAVRKRLDADIQRCAIMNHGDFSPNNVIIDVRKRKLSVIDFGNARRFDPMSDLADSVIQLSLFSWQWNLPHAVVSRLKTAFFRSYEQLQPLSHAQRFRFHVFTAWWSLQSLSYILDTFHDPRKHKKSIIRESLARARNALATRR
ncbi:MAG: phosphotransferase [bacterium]